MAKQAEVQVVQRELKTILHGVFALGGVALASIIALGFATRARDTLKAERAEAKADCAAAISRAEAEIKAIGDIVASQQTQQAQRNELGEIPASTMVTIVTQQFKAAMTVGFAVGKCDGVDNRARALPETLRREHVDSLTELLKQPRSPLDSSQRP